MAFDFKKETGRSAGGGNPFEGGGSGGSFSGGGSFGGNGGSFGGSGNSASGGPRSSGGGFKFGGESTEKKSGEGFSNLPARQTEDKSVNSRSSTKRRSGSNRSGGSVDVPWKMIISVLVIITVFCLIVANWDLITYVFYKIISMLIILIILIFILKMMFRRK